MSIDKIKNAKIVFLLGEAINKENVDFYKNDFFETFNLERSKFNTYDFPEAHIHNRVLQEKCSKIKNGIQSGLKYVVVTHSQSMVNLFGFYVGMEEIDKEDVAVLLFDKDSEEKLMVSYFNEDGFLKNWKFGFFEMC